MKQILFFAYLLMHTIIHSTILGVSLDGTQPYYHIQNAINASAHGDTVLVYPGRYYENLSLSGKNITLASLELITGMLTYKYSTILDGYQNGSVVAITTGESNVTIRGFTITNGNGNYFEGYGYYGGGVYIGALSGQRRVNITNCHIAGNKANVGGGLRVSACDLYLSGTSIINNIAGIGGGIRYQDSTTNPWSIHFDPVNRCNIYSNYGALGTDINTYWVNSTVVIVDTFSVISPSSYYANGVAYNSSITNPFTFDILRSVHHEINQDLFVAPWGDDNSSGLSSAEPLKTIFLATYKIASDSLNPKTIYLADGYYSSSANDQLLPISLKDNIKLIGQSRENTIINCEDNSFCLLPSYSKSQVIKSLSVVNPRTVISSSRTSGVEVDYVAVTSSVNTESAFRFLYGDSIRNLKVSNVSIDSVTAEEVRAIYAIPFMDSIIIDGLSIQNCHAMTKLRLLGIEGMGTVKINNFRASNNTSASSDDFSFNSIMQISPSQTSQRMRVEFSNSVFTNNYQGRYQHMAHVRALNDTVFFNNCTFADNSGGSQLLSVQGTSVLSNNIFWDPSIPTEVWIADTSGINSHSTFRHNVIRNGISGVVNSGSQNPMIWEDNNHSFDPLFAMTGNHPYSLSAESPLIDLGMDGEGAPDYSDFDAGGNERIWDGDGDGIARIDIGAYEYQPIFAPVNLEASVYGNEVFLLWEHPGNSRRAAAEPVRDENIKKSTAKSGTVIPDSDRESRRLHHNPQQWKNGNRAHVGYRIYRNGLPYTDILDPETMYFEDCITQSDTLTYYVKALYGYVESAPSNEVSVYVEVVSNSDESMPGIAFLQVSPNPFREIAVIKIGIKEPGLSRLDVYNLKGQKVKTIINENLGKGEHYFCWNGDDDSGRNVSSGVYFLSYGNNNRILLNRKVLLLK